MSASAGRKHKGRHELFSTSRREELALGPVNRRGQKPSAAKARITVTVRKRPLSNEELKREEFDVVEVLDRKSLILQEPRKELQGTEKTTPHEYSFDRVYDKDCSNHFIYNSCVKKLVDTVFREGSRCSCFAFGQTGSGKTYTMMGAKKTEQPGLWEWAAHDIIAWMSKPEFKAYELAVSFFEIHCNKAYDLLNNRTLVRPLENSDGGVVVKGLLEVVVRTEGEMMQRIDQGNNARSTGRNSRNNESSRSHAILSITVRQAINSHGSGSYPRLTKANTSVGQATTSSRAKDKGGNATTDNLPQSSKERDVNYHTYGKIAFIDLAGSERGADTVQHGRSAQQDGAGINKSLLALKECIRAMDQGKGHIPFRDSELTKILRDFFTNPNGLCCMIATIASSNGCVEQTLNTLRYAQRFIAVRHNAKPCIDEPSSQESIPDQSYDEEEENENDLPVDNDDDECERDDDDSDDSYSANAPIKRQPLRPESCVSKITAAADAPPSSASSRSNAGNYMDTMPRKLNRIVPRNRPTTTTFSRPETKSQLDSSADEKYSVCAEFIHELSTELQIDLEELLEETMDGKTMEIVGQMFDNDEENGPEDLGGLSEDEFERLHEGTSRDLWVHYRELLGHQTVYLRDVCQLIQAHVRICRMMDNHLEHRPGSGSVLRGGTPYHAAGGLSAKTSLINSNYIQTSRIFLEREITALVKLSQNLQRVQNSLVKFNQLQKEQKRRAVKNVQIY